MPGYGVLPKEKISHKVTPSAQTSLCTLKMRSLIASTEIHLIGIRSCWIEIWFCFLIVGWRCDFVLLLLGGDAILFCYWWMEIRFCFLIVVWGRDFVLLLLGGDAILFRYCWAGTRFCSVIDEWRWDFVSVIDGWRCDFVLLLLDGDALLFLVVVLECKGKNEKGI